MAVSSVVVLQGANKFIADVTATADGDTAVVVPHGLGATPLSAIITPLLQVAAGLALWAVTALDATNVTVTKSVVVGTGVAGAQLRVEVALPHSLTR